MAERKCAGVLAELEKATPKRLAESTGLSTGAITGIVDRLERAGFASRERNPDDRRSIIVRAENSVRLARLTMPAFDSLTAAMSKLDASYAPQERTLILRHLRDTIAILHEQTAQVGARES